MENAVGVGLGEPFRDVEPEPDDLLERQAARLLDPFAERMAFDQLHDDPVAVRALEQIVDVDDRGMIEARRGLRLAPQPLPKLSEPGVGADVLDGNRTFEPLVPGAPDNPHAAAPYRLGKPVGTDPFGP